MRRRGCGSAALIVNSIDFWLLATPLASRPLYPRIAADLLHGPNREGQARRGHSARYYDATVSTLCGMARYPTRLITDHPYLVGGRRAFPSGRDSACERRLPSTR